MLRLLDCGPNFSQATDALLGFDFDLTVWGQPGQGWLEGGARGAVAPGAKLRGGAPLYKNL